MCTVIVLNELVPGFPLVVAANRDESYDRSSAEPMTMYQATPVPHVIRPWDNVAAGTWIGAHAGGWFVAVTNQDSDGPDSCGTFLSRGTVANEALWDNSHTAVVKRLLRLKRDLYRPFNLVYGRPGAVFLTSVKEDRDLGIKVLDPGISVITNDCWDNAYQNKERRARARVEAIDLSGPMGDVALGLRRALADHSRDEGEGWHHSICTHSPDELRGTCSTSIISVSDDGSTEYRYSNGPACSASPLRLVGRLPGTGTDEEA